MRAPPADREQAMDAATEAELDALVDGVWARLFRTGYALTGDKRLAEDAVQAVCARAGAHWRRVRQMSAPEAHLHGQLVRGVCSWRRRPAMRSEPPAPPDPPARSRRQAGPTADEVWDALRWLPPGQRAVIVLRGHDGLDEPEVARVLRVRSATVTRRRAAAMARLRSVLPNESPPAGGRDVDGLDEAVRAALRECVDRARPPPVDRSALRRRGLRDVRRRRLGFALAVVMAAATVTVGVRVGGDRTPGGDPAPVPAGLVPAPVDGLRAFVSYPAAEPATDHPAGLHVGAVVARADHLAGAIAGTLSTSPYGVAMIATDSAAGAGSAAPYLVTAGGDELRLGAPTDPRGTGFDATLASDPDGPYLAWSSRTGGGVRLHLYALAAGTAVATTDLPCADAGCTVQVVATAGGVVFVRTAAGTSIWDPDRGDGLVPLTAAEVIGVGGRTVLLDGSHGHGSGPSLADGPLAGGGWRLAWSDTVDDQVSGDGRWLLGYAANGARTLTRVRVDGSTADVTTVAHPTVAAFDTDSSLLAVRDRGGGRFLLVDCVLPRGTCTDVYRSGAGGEPELFDQQE